MNKLLGRGLYWRLDGHNVVPGTLDDFVRAYENDEARIVGSDMVGDKRVSTVFLAMDHAFTGPPLLFETGIFGEDEEGTEGTWRYRTWDEAAAGHARVIAALRAGEQP